MVDRFFSLILISISIFFISCELKKIDVIEKDNKYEEYHSFTNIIKSNNLLRSSESWNLFFVDSTYSNVKAFLSSSDISELDGTQYLVQDSIASLINHSHLIASDRVILYAFGKFIFDGTIRPISTSSCCDCVIMDSGYKEDSASKLYKGNRLEIMSSCDFLMKLPQ